MTPARSRLPRSALVLVLALLSVGCGALPARQGMPVAPAVVEVEADPALAAMVPDWLRESGSLRVAVDPRAKPLNYYDAKRRLTGVEVQLASAIAQLLDLEPVFLSDASAAMEGELLGGRYELGASAVAVARGGSFAVDAVVYLYSDLRLVRPRDSLIDFDSLCGRKVAVFEGSRILDWLDEQSAECLERGQAGIASAATFDDERMSRAVLTGSADALLASGPVSVALAKAHAAELEPAPGATEPMGLVLLAPPGRELADLYASAIESLFQDGRYAQLLRSFGLEESGQAPGQVVLAGRSWESR